MSIKEQSDLLIKVILQDAKKQQNEIILKSKQALGEIKKIATDTAQMIKSKSQKPFFSHTINAKALQEISKAELNSQLEIANFKKKILDDILLNIHDLLSKTKSDEQYPVILKNLIIDGIKNLKGPDRGNYILFLSLDDKNRIDKKVLAEIEALMGVTIDIGSFDSSIEAGVLVQKKNEALVYDNSLNGIMKRQRDNLNNMANNMLWSEI